MTGCCWDIVGLAVGGTAGEIVVRDVLMTLLAPAGLGRRLRIWDRARGGEEADDSGDADGVGIPCRERWWERI